MLVTRNLQWRLTARDASLDSGLMRGTFKPGTSVEDGLSALTDLRGALSAISDCVFVRQSVTIAQSQQPKEPPSGATRASQVGAFFFAGELPDRFGLARVPGIPATYTVDSDCGAGIVIEASDPTVAALIDEVTSGIWCNPFGTPLVSFVSAYIREES